MTPKINFIIADYHNKGHQKDIIRLLDNYAQDKMGGAKPLSTYVKDHLISELEIRPHVFSILCQLDGVSVAIANCVEGFSTFAAKPLLNIHDLAINFEYRGQGLSQKLLAAIKQEADVRGCCKVTLEVLSNNEVACKAYKKFGFEPYILTEAGGPAQFWQLKL